MLSIATGDDACARSPRRVSAPCRARVRSWQSAPAPWQVSGSPLRSRGRIGAASDDHLRSLIDRQGFVLGFDLDAANALGEQQPLDPVDVRSPLADQPGALTVRAPQILLVDTWNAHQRPNVPLAPAPGDQRS